MASRIEDYAVIGNRETLALVGLDGSIDWLSLPRFDSPACFSALVGEAKDGYWQIAPVRANAKATRRYRGNTLILETTFETETGAVSVTDFMSNRPDASDVIRIVRGIRGTVAMLTRLVVRFGYGSVVPWVHRQDDERLRFVAGPDRLLVQTDVPLHGENMQTVGEFDVTAGDTVTMSLTWTPSYRAAPEPVDCSAALEAVTQYWEDWASKCQAKGPWAETILRSLITLKALTHWETGGIVAAGTTSLPESLGGSRNWDYRYCWLRDATFTLYAFMHNGFLEEAKEWRAWLLRAVAGNPNALRIMYGVAGERRLDEYEIPWLSGYEGAKPVRVGNAASGQVQLDVYGEVLDALYTARKAGLAADEAGWALECALIAHLETIWDKPDDGIWEMRSERQHFVHSKVMAWVAFDRAIRSAEEFSLEAPLEKWRDIRDRIHDEVCSRGFNTARNTFVQAYHSSALDASLLLIPLVGFLPASDPRVRGTLEAIETKLIRGGFVMRYDTTDGGDGLPPGEGAFLACSFWLVDNYVLQERFDDAEKLFSRLLALCNDVGLLAEEYDVQAKRQTGNFPQAFSHLALINSASNLSSRAGPARERSKNADQAEP